MADFPDREEVIGAANCVLGSAVNILALRDPQTEVEGYLQTELNEIVAGLADAMRLALIWMPKPDEFDTRLLTDVEHWIR
jgi:hypothetical protein